MEWKSRCETTASEMEDVARDLKNLQTEHTKLRQQFSEMTSDLESVRRDSKQKQLMIDELNENVGDLTKRSHDAEKGKKKSEMEKEELANQLEVMPSQCVPTRTRSSFLRRPKLHWKQKREKFSRTNSSFSNCSKKWLNVWRRKTKKRKKSGETIQHQLAV